MAAEVERAFRWKDNRVVDTSNLATIILLKCCSLTKREALAALEETNELFNKADESVESPVEAMLLYALCAVDFATTPDGDVLSIVPQKRIDRFRVDFLIDDDLVVEVDGHDFHERTKDQAKRDKSRDRLLTRQHRVIRFTGSEIYNAPFACAAEALSFIGKRDVGVWTGGAAKAADQTLRGEH